MTLPPILALHPDVANNIAFAVLLIAAVVSIVLAVLAFLAHRRTGAGFLPFLIAAFVVSAAKSVFVAYNLRVPHVPHTQLELFDAGADMAIVLLIALPFVVPGVGRPRDDEAPERSAHE